MNSKRITAIGTVFCVLLLFLSGVHLRICLFKSKDYTENVVKQRTDSIVLKSRRGKFYDRNMIPLVENTVSRADIAGVENSGGFVLPVRYGKNSLACHLIGYTNSEGKGASGLEKTFDGYLDSTSEDKLNVVKTANGKVISGAGVKFDAGLTEGDSVVLTLDCHIQNVCENVLNEHNVTGAVVVMDVESFDILAMASSPFYCQNDISKHMSGANGEFVNRCVSGYNAGSIFKIVTLSSAIENQALKYGYICNGKADYYEHSFKCHNSQGHGGLKPDEALSDSCNCAFYSMGMDLGAEKIIKTALDFGFGESVVCCSGFNEFSGNIPLKNCYAPLDALNYSIGQGEILLTPLQAANMVAIVANGGVALKTNIADRVISSDGNCRKILREVGGFRIILPHTAEFVSDAMRLAVTDGTAWALGDSPALIAGKTGTAETGWQEKGKTMVHGWFCGFFPYNNPKYAMAVLVENGISGAQSAAPVFKDIAEEIIKIYPLG